VPLYLDPDSDLEALQLSALPEVPFETSTLFSELFVSPSEGAVDGLGLVFERSD
jgi:hypothetical protein